MLSYTLYTVVDWDEGWDKDEELSLVGKEGVFATPSSMGQ